MCRHCKVFSIIYLVFWVEIITVQKTTEIKLGQWIGPPPPLLRECLVRECTETSVTWARVRG
jgi:hypothetical protein